MAVSYVGKMWSKAGGSLRSDTADPFSVQYAFTDGYQVLLDAPESDQVTVISGAQSAGLPVIGDQKTGGINAYVKEIKASQVTPIFWIVDVAYEGVSDDTSTVQVEWSDSSSTEPIDRDWNGFAIVNTVNDPVEGLSMDLADQVCTIRRKFSAINTAAISVYRRSTNSDTFLGWPAGTCRLVGYSAVNEFSYGAPTQLWEVTARFQFREPFYGTTNAQSWYKRVRNEGLYYRDANGNRGRVLDDFGQESMVPRLLKQNGEQEFNPNNAYFVHWQVYGSLPYSALGLV